MMMQRGNNPVHFLLDSLLGHKTAMIRDHYAATNACLTLYALPSYAPELIHDELAWRSPGGPCARTPN